MNTKKAKNLAFITLIVVVSAASGWSYYNHSFNNHLSTVNGEADRLLALTSSYVSLYSELRHEQHETPIPVPATYRAQAAQAFESNYKGDKHFTAKMVGVPDRYIATAPATGEMSDVLNEMSINGDKGERSQLVKLENDTIVRTMYPSIAKKASCVNCHNNIQKPAVPWKKGDLMGAYVIERSVLGAKVDNALIGVLIGFLVALSLFSVYKVWQLNRALSRRADQLKTLSETDPLTGCLNRRALDSKFGVLSQIDQDNSALLVLDLDHFKNVNDTHGHDVGDSVLIWFSDTVRSQLRKDDVLARLGGEEFSVYLPSTTEDEARNIAARICQKVSEEELNFSSGNFKVSVSIGGIHTSKAPKQTLSMYGKVADKLLYEAKSNGRNRVVWGIKPSGA